MSDLATATAYVGDVRAEIERVEALPTDQMLEYLADRVGAYTVAASGGRYRVDLMIASVGGPEEIEGSAYQVVSSTQEVTLRDAVLCAVRGVIAWKGPMA